MGLNHGLSPLEET